MARGAFSTRTGFIFAAVGSAVGLGNLWRFPYFASTNGGAAFLIIYLALLFLIGLPALMAELSLGRRSRRNAIDAYSEDGKRPAWGFAGGLAIFGAGLLLSYYSVIAGWSLRYAFDSLRAVKEAPPFFGADEGEAATSYWSNIATGPEAILAHAIFMAVTLYIVWRGVSKGIEKANLIMMPILFLTVIGLAIYANLQSGAGAGREFYLEPDWGEVSGSTISNASGQTFFSIGLGIGTMLTYSSYLNRKEDLQSTGLIIGFADTGVAVLAGFMVFPLIFSLGLQDALITGEGSVGGLFIAVPTAFANLDLAVGSWLAGAFFVMLSFAALSSAISLLEVPVSALLDRFPKWGRWRAVLLMGLPIYAFGLFAANDVDFLVEADYLINRVVLITGGFLLAIYVGWIRPEILNEMTLGRKGRDLGVYFRPVIRYVLPVLLGALMVIGYLGYLSDMGWVTYDGALGRLVG